MRVFAVDGTAHFSEREMGGAPKQVVHKLGNNHRWLVRPTYGIVPPMQHNTSTHATNEHPCKSRAVRLVVDWALAIIWAGFIFFMSAKTGSGLNDDFGLFSLVYQQIKAVQEHIFGPGIDALSPVAHFFEYLVFGMLLVNLLRNFMPLKRACLLAIVVASLYGATDEFHQYFVPERMCDPIDWLVDTVGASAGSGILYLALRKRMRKTSKATHG